MRIIDEVHERGREIHRAIIDTDGRRLDIDLLARFIIGRRTVDIDGLDDDRVAVERPSGD